MLALASASLSFSAPAMPRSFVSSRIGAIAANANNEMEPDEGWNVDNLTGMMEDAVQASGGEAAAMAPAAFDVKKLAGITDPLGFFDPLGFCTDASEGKIRFYREVEVSNPNLNLHLHPALPLSFILTPCPRHVVSVSSA